MFQFYFVFKSNVEDWLYLGVDGQWHKPVGGQTGEPLSGQDLMLSTLLSSSDVPVPFPFAFDSFEDVEEFMADQSYDVTLIQIIQIKR